MMLNGNLTQSYQFLENPQIIHTTNQFVRVIHIIAT